MQSQAALRGVTLPDHRHQRRHCTEGSRNINTTRNSDASHLFTSCSPLLTVMVCGDVDAFTGRFLGTELRHPIERLDGEGVSGVRQQAPHLHPATQKAVPRWTVAGAVSAGETRALGRPAHRALDRVAQVRSAAVVQRLVPHETKCGVVHLG